MQTVLPAFGRNYNKVDEAKLDWFLGKDFVESASRQACSIREINEDVIIRYGKNLTKTCHYEAAKDNKRLAKLVAKDRATRPQYHDFREWKSYFDLEVEQLSSMSTEDLADWDFYAAFDDGIEPNVAARQFLEEEGFPLD